MILLNKSVTLDLVMTSEEHFDRPNRHFKPVSDITNQKNEGNKIRLHKTKRIRIPDEVKASW